MGTRRGDARVLVEFSWIELKTTKIVAVIIRNAKNRLYIYILFSAKSVNKLNRNGLQRSKSVYNAIYMNWTVRFFSAPLLLEMKLWWHIIHSRDEKTQTSRSSVTRSTKKSFCFESPSSLFFLGYRRKSSSRRCPSETKTIALRFRNKKKKKNESRDFFLSGRFWIHTWEHYTLVTPVTALLLSGRAS